jgi:hypothetical protein
VVRRSFMTQSRHSRRFGPHIRLELTGLLGSANLRNRGEQPSFERMFGLHFFLYEIVARIVAIYLCVDCGRKLWYGLVKRKIAYFNPNLLFGWSGVADRDAAPIQYWIQIGLRIIMLVACLFVAIFGWWQPNT